MDITNVDDKRRFTATVTIKADENGTGPVILYNCTVRFAPPGWLTVEQGEGDAQTTAIYPADAVISVVGLEEAPSTGRVQVF